MHQQKKINIFFRPAGIVIFLLIIFIIVGAAAWIINYSEGKKAAAAADKIQQGIIRLHVLAVNRQMVNNRVPQSYYLTLSDCRGNCFYEIGAVTAEGEQMIIEKVFLGDIYIRSLRPEPGIFRLSLLSGEAYQTSSEARLLEIGSTLIQKSFIASFGINDYWQPVDFKSFAQKLPEAFLSGLSTGNIANIEVASKTDSGLPKSIGIYWRKEGGFPQLSVKLKQLGSPEEKVLRSEIRDFDSQLATICFDLPSGATSDYLVTLEPLGRAEERAKNISLRVFSEYNCEGDNLPTGIEKIEVTGQAIRVGNIKNE